MITTNAATSLVRTAVPYLVAWLLSLSFAAPVEHALGVTDGQARVALTGVLVFAVGTLYYAGVRGLERIDPRLGLLLGVPSRPSYAPTATLSGAGGLSAASIAEQAGAQLVNDVEPFLVGTRRV